MMFFKMLQKKTKKNTKREARNKQKYEIFFYRRIFDIGNFCSFLVLCSLSSFSFLASLLVPSSSFSLSLSSFFVYLISSHCPLFWFEYFSLSLSPSIFFTFLHHWSVLLFILLKSLVFVCLLCFVFPSSYETTGHWLAFCILVVLLLLLSLFLPPCLFVCLFVVLWLCLPSSSLFFSSLFRFVFFAFCSSSYFSVVISLSSSFSLFSSSFSSFFLAVFPLIKVW